MSGDLVDDIQREYLEIITQVKSHLEYQKALGVNFVEVPAPAGVSGKRTTGAGIPSSMPVANQEKKEVPPIPSVGMSKPAGPLSSELSAVRIELGECTRCKLHKGRKTIVFGEGDPNAVIVFVGEGPGQEEDEQGRPFVGAAGQLLTDIIVKGMKLKREDVYICNIVKCRPPGNRNPEPDEIDACEPFLIKQLQAIKPKMIVGLGNVAVKTLLKTKEGITSLRGTWHTYQGILLMPTFHPAYLLRNPRDKALVWEDIKKVIAEMKKLEK
jgi:uracil-DNA glycosylase family 4